MRVRRNRSPALATNLRRLTDWLRGAHPDGQPSLGAKIKHTNLASLSDRILGQILDSLVAIAAYVIAGVLSAFAPTLGVIALIIAVVYSVYYILLADGFAGGQSYGKRVVHTAVIDATSGAPCTFGKSFVRNFLLALLGPIDWIFIFGSKRQRLGDKAANTIVIKTSPGPGTPV
jgi:uncharacterized RDD family membrane protein YckC